jgi:hypothetical protein
MNATPLPFLLALGIGSTAFAFEEQSDTKVSVEAGFDSNPFRTFDSVGEPTGSEVPSAFVLVMGTTNWSLRTESTSLVLSFMAGAKGFLPAYGASDVAQNLDATWALELPKAMRAGVQFQERTLNTIVDDRDSATVGGVGFLEMTLATGLSLRFNLGLRQYWFLSDGDYNSFGPDMGVVIRFVPARRHSFFAASDLSPRRYASDVRSPQYPYPYVDGVPRQDTEVFATAGYAYRGAFAAQLAYEFFADLSNSFGERIDRHRVVAGLGAKIPVIDVFANVNAILELAVYPDGVYLQESDVALEDDERHSSITVTLAKPLSPRWELDAEYAFYVSTFFTDGYYYVRHVATLGISARF